MIRSCLTNALIALVVSLGAVEPASAQQAFGSQLMTPQERADHRAKMRSLPPAEREAYRAQHHVKMRKRAEAMGLTLPDTVPPTVGRSRGGPDWGYPGRGFHSPGYAYPGLWRGYGFPGRWESVFPDRIGSTYGAPKRRSFNCPIWR